MFFNTTLGLKQSITQTADERLVVRVNRLMRLQILRRVETPWTVTANVRLHVLMTK